MVLLYSLDPKYTQFATVAQGTATGWDPTRDAEVRTYFAEERLLCLRDQNEYTTFAARLRSLLGVELPMVDLQGDTLLAVLGAPVNGPRPFEVLELDRSTPGKVSLGMLYEAEPTHPGPPPVSYHIIRHGCRTRTTRRSMSPC